MLDDIFRLTSSSDSLLNAVDLASASLSRRLAEEAGKASCDEEPLSEYDTGIEGFDRFCREVLQITTWSGQRKIVESYFKNLRTAVRSGHSVGKTTIVAAICSFHFAVRGLPFYTTAPGKEAVNDGVWKEIRRLVQGATRKLPGWISENSPVWKVDGAAGWWGKGFSTNKAERAQGRHEVGLLVVADEAAGVEEFVWDALESSMASDDVRMLIIGNPNYERKTFYHAFHEQKHLWECIHISSLDSPNITGLEPAVPGLAGLEWAEHQKSRYKDEPDKYRMRVLGEWPLSDSVEKCLPMEWIEASQQLWLELEEEEPYYDEEPLIHSAFVDVAGWGKDNSALSYLRGQRFHVEFETHDTSPEGLMLLAERVDAWVRSKPPEQKPKWLAVDCDAIGAGVFSRLSVLKGRDPEGWGRCQLIKFNWGGAATEPGKYQYQIDECHWNLREAINPRQPRSERLALPPGNRIAAQLNLRKYTEDPRERKKVETKQQLKERNAQSPDVADSIVGCVHRPKLTGVRRAA